MHTSEPFSPFLYSDIRVTVTRRDGVGLSESWLVEQSMGRERMGEGHLGKKITRSAVRGVLDQGRKTMGGMDGWIV